MDAASDVKITQLGIYFQIKKKTLQIQKKVLKLDIIMETFMIMELVENM
jgi:hypothetical protein